jgi:signal transduction histidine kinase
MRPPELWTRVLIGAIAAVMPLAALALLVLTTPGMFTVATPGLLAAGLIMLAVIWGLILTLPFARLMSHEGRALVDLARRGGEASADTSRGDEAAGAQGRLAATLEERNRQVSELAHRGSAAPISGSPAAMAHHVTGTARRVTRDPTWMLAVTVSPRPNLLPLGVYDDVEEHNADALGDMERWVATARSDLDAPAPHRAEGPWGAFVVVPLASTTEMRAALFAPWEGRPDPSAADVALFKLLAQHGGTTLHHALLFGLVREQAADIDRMAAVQRDFLRGVSHDLQTPLASIRAAAAELRTASGDLDDAARGDLDLIEHQSDRLRRMVAQLLAVSRLEAGALMPRQDVFAAQPIVKRTWAALRSADRELKLAVDGPEHLVVGDPDRFEQVVWALLDNAVKYSPAGSAIEVALGAVNADTGLHARLRVTDEGPGMDSETLGRAFEQFFRSEGARRMAPDGSGIGLYAARGLVEAMGGSLRAESQLGRGTTFTLEMPAEPAEEPATIA